MSKMSMGNVARRATGRGGRARRALSSILFVLCASTIASQGTATAVTGAPVVAFVTRPGHSLAVAGKNWGHHVIVTAQIGTARGVAVLDTMAGGTFVVALDFSVPCGGLTVDVQDLRGHHVTLRRPGPLCPNRVGEPPPTVSILQGTSRATKARTISFSSAPHSLTARLGEKVEIIERAGSTPYFLPVADAQHFLLVQQESPGSASCMAACAPGGDSWWKWVVVKTGHGSLHLVPTCRQSHPPCEIVERVINVTITK